MTWTAPVTKAVGDPLGASDWNTYIRDNPQWLHDNHGVLAGGNSWTGDQVVSGQVEAANHCCRVYRTAALSVANNTNTTVSFDGEHYDIGGLHAAGTTSRLTAVTAGKYLIFAAIEWAANTAGMRQLGILVGGATYVALDSRPPAVGGDNTRQAISTVYHLAASDYVEMQVYQDSGGALNLDAAANYSPEFGMNYLCA